MTELEREPRFCGQVKSVECRSIEQKVAFCHAGASPPRCSSPMPDLEHSSILPGVERAPRRAVFSEGAFARWGVVSTRVVSRNEHGGISQPIRTGDAAPRLLRAHILLDGRYDQPASGAACRP
jgi:hypothetical protein